MHVPRMSVARLMVLVVAIALNLAAFRAIFGGNDLGGEAIVSLIVMVNVLAFGAYRRLSRPNTRFNLGFLGFGLVAALVHLACLILCNDAVTAAMGVILDPLSSLYEAYTAPLVEGAEEGLAMLAVAPYILAAASFAALPQLLAACVGGWLTSRWCRRAGREMAAA